MVCLGLLATRLKHCQRQADRGQFVGRNQRFGGHCDVAAGEFVLGLEIGGLAHTHPHLVFNVAKIIVGDDRFWHLVQQHALYHRVEFGLVCAQRLELGQTLAIKTTVHRVLLGNIFSHVFDEAELLFDLLGDGWVAGVEVECVADANNVRLHGVRRQCEQNFFARRKHLLAVTELMQEWHLVFGVVGRKL